MADKRISQLIERTDIANNDVLPIVASGATTTNKVTISTIQDWMQENLDVGVTSVGITFGTSGTDINASGSPVTSSGNITINLPTASATNRGALSSADWITFNAKQPAGNYVTLDTAQTITAQKTFTTSGSSDTMIISHGSGSGFALDVIKAGNGETLRVTKTSGSGNAMSVIGGVLSTEGISSTAPANAISLLLNGRSADNVGIIAFGANTGGGQYNFIQASPTSLIVGSRGNTPLEFHTNVNGGGGSRMTISGSGDVTLTGALQGTSARFSAGVALTSDGGTNQQTTFINTSAIYSGSSGSNILGFNGNNNIYFSKGLANGGVIGWNNSVARSYLLPDADGTISLTSDLGAYLPLTGGTLTGALNGTSATFSGNILSNNFLYVREQNASTLLANYTQIYANSTFFGFTNGAGTGSAVFTYNGVANYTLPSASGTIALTTDLGAYLPLTGGTLTGGLNGTSASFTGAVISAAVSVTATTGIAGDFTNNSSTNETLRARNNGSGNIAAFRNLSAEVASITNSGGLTLSGALNGTSAIFTGQVTANGNLSITKDNPKLILNDNAGGSQNNFSISSNFGFFNLNDETAAGASVMSYGGGLFNFTGAATFSSSGLFSGNLQSNGVLTIGNQNVAGNYVLQITPSTTSANKVSMQAILAGVGISDIVMQPSGGNVGIGTASPQKRLDVFTTASSATEYQLSLRNGAGANNVSTGIAFGFNSQSFDPDYLSAISSIITNRSTRAADLTFLTAATGSLVERMRITSDGFTRLSASSGGIQFNGDTAAANALDDYEEGTWTMGVAFDGNSVGITYVSNTGRYTKIGRQVTVTGYLALSNKGTSTGHANITGLPFTIQSDASNYSAPSFWWHDITYLGQFNGYGAPNSNNIELWETLEIGSISTITNNDFFNNSRFMVSFTYFV
jgi:hypothetical protein